VEITYSLRSLVFYIARTSDNGWWSINPYKELFLTIFWCGYFFVSLVQLVGSCELTATEVRCDTIFGTRLVENIAQGKKPSFFQSQRTTKIVHDKINEQLGDQVEKQVGLW